MDLASDEVTDPGNGDNEEKEQEDQDDPHKQGILEITLGQDRIDMFKRVFCLAKGRLKPSTMTK
jgi:hypothetical protein